MCRCLYSVVLTVSLSLCGCTKKDAPPEAAAVAVQPPPTQPAESNTPTPPAQPEHPVIATAREFLKNIDAGNYSRALSLAIPGEITQQSLDGMHQAFQWDQATFAQVWVGTEQAGAITNPVPAKQGSVTMIWAFNLVATDDGHWLVRLTDLLRTPEEVEDYVAALREVAPDAKSIPIEP